MKFYQLWNPKRDWTSTTYCLIFLSTAVIEWTTSCSAGCHWRTREEAPSFWRVAGASFGRPQQLPGPACLAASNVKADWCDSTFVSSSPAPARVWHRKLSQSTLNFELDSSESCSRYVFLSVRERRSWLIFQIQDDANLELKREFTKIHLPLGFRRHVENWYSFRSLMCLFSCVHFSSWLLLKVDCRSSHSSQLMIGFPIKSPRFFSSNLVNSSFA